MGVIYFLIWLYFFIVCCRILCIFLYYIVGFVLVYEFIMVSMIFGVKVDDFFCLCFKDVVVCFECIFYWLIKQVIFVYFEWIEYGQLLFELLGYSGVMEFVDGQVVDGDDDNLLYLFFEFVQNVQL